MTARARGIRRRYRTNGDHVKTILTLVFLALPLGAYGQLLKCVSKNGKVEYAQSCPEGTTEQRLRSGPTTPAGSSSSPAPAQKSLAERDAEFKKRQIEQQEAAQKDSKKATEMAQRREDCEVAQSYLKSIDSGQRLQRTDPKTGERVFLEDAEREAEANRARSRMADACKQ